MDRLQNVSMNLPDYIKEHGTERCATLFGVSKATIKAWRWGYRSPRPEAANRIVAATGGEVSLAGIYASRTTPKSAEEKLARLEAENAELKARAA